MNLASYKKPKNQKSLLVLGSWYLLNYYFFASSIPWPVTIKILILRLYGARVDSSVVLKPRVRIKYPWNLYIAENVWIGEDVWFDNVDKVEIADNVCISQGVMFLTGNHDYKTVDFRFYSSPIMVESNSWITAKCILLPGAKIISGSVLSPGSIIKKVYNNERIKYEGLD